MTDIEDIAAGWAVKADAGPLEPTEEAALDAWLNIDSRNLGAYARAKAALAFASPERLRTYGDAPSLRRSGGLFSVSRRGLISATGMAACGAGVAIGAPWFLSLFAGERYATGVGETQVIPLSDGSVVTLNTNSRIRVNFSKERRDVALVQGEALFDVAKNKERPFIVTAASTQIRAVGTSFTVRLLPDQPLRVLVREGVVEVKRPNVPAGAPVRLEANVQGDVPPAAPIRATPVPEAEVTRALAWRVGRIAFEGEPLKDAAAEFGRYSDVKIVIDAPDVENQTVAGLFVSNDPVGFSKAVAASFNLRMEISGNTVRLSH